MLRKKITYQTGLIVNRSLEGESIEQKMERILDKKEPVTDGAPIIFQERKDGVAKEFDIRTDRWDLAQEVKGAIDKSKIAKRVEFKPEFGKGESAGAEPTQGTE